MPAATDRATGLGAPATPPRHRYHRFTPRAPTISESLGLLALTSLVLGLLAYGWAPLSWAEGAFLVFLLPAVIGGFATTPLAEALGGRFALRRSLLLAMIVLLSAVPIVAVWRLLVVVFPATAWPGVTAIIFLAQGPALWLRYMSLYGVSNPSHSRTLAPAIIQPVLVVAAVAAVHGLTWTWGIEAVLFLLLGWGTSLLVLDATDRPIRRAFQASGVSLLRPLLDHVDLRDPEATRRVEAFFGQKTQLADLNVTVVGFGSDQGWKATVCLPTVHPGPFAAFGASDLPHKLAQGFGPRAGTVFVPHTPCNHDLDLPGGAEVDRVRDAAIQLLGGLHTAPPTISSPLVSPRPGSLARCQILGGAAVVVVTQAPAPTDDIDFAVVGGLYERHWSGTPPLMLALIDAHNSYVEDEGDLTYGSPAHHQLLQDVDAAIQLARERSSVGPIRVGCASRTDYTVGQHGIGPEGIRALVAEAGGETTAYVLIDGNNLVLGARATILAALEGLVGQSEVMTTDNHVVHEVDGGVNPVGERYSASELARDIRGLVDRAVHDLGTVDIAVGRCEVPAVPVLGPAYTARLLTSLADTGAVFADAVFMTLALLLTGSLCVLAILR